MFTRQNGLTLEEYRKGHNTTKLIQCKLIQKLYKFMVNIAKENVYHNHYFQLKTYN